MFEVVFFLFYLTLPFSFALNPVEGIDLPIARLFMVLLFIWWFVRISTLRTWKISFPLGFALFLFWLTWAELSSVWAIESLWSARKMIFLLNVSLVGLILFSYHEKGLKKIKEAVIWSSILVTGVALLEVLLQLVYPIEAVMSMWFEYLNPFFLGQEFSAAVKDYPSFLVNILGNTYLRATGFFPDPHTLSLYLGTTLPLVFVWQREKSFLRTIIFSLSCLAFVFTFSRGAYIALFGSMVVATVLFGKDAIKKYWREALVVGILVATVTFFTPVGARFLSSWSSEDGSRIERIRLLVEAVENIKERPLLGVGVGNYPLLVNPNALERDPIYAHNLYLDIAVEQGLVGLGLFLLFIGSFLIYGYQEWRRVGGPYQAASFVGVSYFLLHGLFEAPLYSYHVMMIVFFLLSYLAREKSYD